MVKVYIREKKMRSGNIYLYLQYRPAVRHPKTKKKMEWEALNLKIFPNPSNVQQKEHNKNMYEAATFMLSKRTMQLVGREYGFIDKFTQDESFTEWMKEMAAVKTNTKWNAVYRHFTKFYPGDCSFGDLDEDICEQFKEYLLETDDTRHGLPLNQNAAAAYYNIFRGALKLAYKNHFIKTNLNDFLTSIPTLKTHKPFLTLEELKQLSNTYCEIDVLKRASLFSCLTGLRISDILNLRWENIVENPYGGHMLSITTIKNQKATENPISEEAYMLCGKPGHGIVFKGLNKGMLYKDLPIWLESAGIEKHITFHCFRHTYATLQIAAGTDIYTVSKMLTHSDIKTTQIYADVVNEQKQATINRISLR